MKTSNIWIRIWLIVLARLSDFGSHAMVRNFCPEVIQRKLSIVLIAVFVMSGAQAGDPSSLLAQAPEIKMPHNALKFDRTIGVCHLSENPFEPTSAVNGLSPYLVVKNYFRVQERRKVEGIANFGVLKMPTHGTLEGPVNGGFAYFPENGFLGNDRATLVVKAGGKTVKIEYFFRVMRSIPDDHESKPTVYEQGHCPIKARVWKISSVLNNRTIS
jgi:hypothetical protein